MNLYERGKSFTRRRGGFTLIELLVVISIIGLLATLTVIAVSRARNNARIAKAKADLKQLSTAIDILAIDAGEWSGHQVPYTVCTDLPGGCPANNELEDLTTQAAGIVDTDGNYTGWKGPYMGQIPQDPWGHNYFFDTDYDVGGGVMRVVIGSYGPNGVGNNLYDTDDVRLIIE